MQFDKDFLIKSGCGFLLKIAVTTMREKGDGHVRSDLFVCFLRSSKTPRLSCSLKVHKSSTSGGGDEFSFEMQFFSTLRAGFVLPQKTSRLKN